MLYYSFPRLDSLQGVFVHSRSVLVLKGTGFGVREKTTTRYVDSVKFDAGRHPHVAFTGEACPWIGALGSSHCPSSVGWSLAASSNSVSPSLRLNSHLFFVHCLRRRSFNWEPITWGSTSSMACIVQHGFFTHDHLLLAGFASQLVPPLSPATSVTWCVGI